MTKQLHHNCTAVSRHHKEQAVMDQSKSMLMDTPPVYSELLPVPRIPCLGGLKKLLCVVLVVVLLVIVLLAVLLMGLHMSQKHTETIFQMSLHDGASSKEKPAEGVATFHLDTGINTSASVIYDYSKMLICTRPRPGHACYITRMEAERIQSLQNIAENVLSKIGLDTARQNEPAKLESDPSVLGTTIRVLCGDLPVYWA
ncbi:pulmonary surfactant-associated protein C [Rana temporaria]|uniref:pulmonary surfactant-associated protein C n=1 Tax=Rana temporaria TaxID=8407 RepID=UPI001AADE48F|nr:pulmonary surfactant-associated protein C [Rana temporaria]